jgi:hypothetical protein
LAPFSINKPKASGVELGVGAGFQQAGDDLRAAALTGQGQRRGAVDIDDIGLGARRQQHVHGLRILAIHRPGQHGGLVRQRRIHGGMLVQQRLDGHTVIVAYRFRQAVFQHARRGRQRAQQNKTQPKYFSHTRNSIRLLCSIRQ